MKRLLLLSVLPLAACAQPVHRITPEVTSSAGFANLQCTNLMQERYRLENALADASVLQEEAVRQDELAVLILGFPVTGGGLNHEIAQIKGQIEAVEQASAGRC